jgi:Uma2 family endonuclease
MFRDREDRAMDTITAEDPTRTGTPTLQGHPSTLQDLVDRLGGVPLSRILASPAPGSATEEDLVSLNESKRHSCELVDGVLVEKAMGFRESMLAIAISAMLRQFVVPRRLGIITGADGTIKLAPSLLRAPDVAFFAWENLPEGRIPDAKIPQLAPTLAIEVLSESNTKAEMDRKRREYFEAGAVHVWLVEPAKRTISVYERGRDSALVYDQAGKIENLAFLPGFQLVLADLFGELDYHEQRPTDA